MDAEKDKPKPKPSGEPEPPYPGPVGPPPRLQSLVWELWRAVHLEASGQRYEAKTGFSKRTYMYGVLHARERRKARSA